MIINYMQYDIICSENPSKLSGVSSSEKNYIRIFRDDQQNSHPK